MNIDYAFADYGEFGNVHRFGLTLKFAKTARQSDSVAVRQDNTPLEVPAEVKLVDEVKPEDKIEETKTELNTEEIKAEEAKPVNTEKINETVEEKTNDEVKEKAEEPAAEKTGEGE